MKLTKLIITIPEKKYKYIKKLAQDNTDYATTRMLYHAVKISTPIPDHATNGDMIKRLLYNHAIITEFFHDVNIRVNNNVIGHFDMEWWRSPYKRGETE